MKYIFIINPISGSTNADDITRKIEELCLFNHYEYEIRLTEYPGHATKIALEYSREENVIYSVGGDGTLNEVVNGIVGSKNHLGIIPTGSGNDFYKIIDSITDKEFSCDIGKVNDRYFINVCSIGIDADVCNNANLLKGKVPPKQIYTASILKTILGYQYKDVKYYMNGEKDNGIFTIVTICNGCYYGGGFYIAPNAKINDNQFDIYFVEKISKIRMIKLVSKLKKGTHVNEKEVFHYVTRNIKLSSSREMNLNIDGEIIKTKKVKIKMIPNAIKFNNDRELVEKVMKLS